MIVVALLSSVLLYIFDVVRGKFVAVEIMVMPSYMCTCTDIQLLLMHKIHQDHIAWFGLHD